VWGQIKVVGGKFVRRITVKKDYPPSHPPPSHTLVTPLVKELLSVLEEKGIREPLAEAAHRTLGITLGKTPGKMPWHIKWHVKWHIKWHIKSA
jgi:hypothetical protein